ncbi:hypothetical protein SAMN02949497_4659 [Methylomagnum ishizawai]|uniref:Uncharacterized protein n=1 Tax=Methylomagnum ishizawai TaxID=1760988 RepID=A0A1Y6D2R1_9GAMM|nr:hypothetical protein [Methylomagnum ishizawai]SMF97239.1 hypothetical protein SAMN02949497_4659 [Methylomagnum ishizawai]
MYIFKSLRDLEGARLSLEISALIRRLVSDLILACHPYDPEADGYVALIEDGGDLADLSALGLPYALDSVPFEAVQVEAGCYVGVFLANNQFGLTVVVPDAPWLPPEYRSALEAQRDFS